MNVRIWLEGIFHLVKSDISYDLWICEHSSYKHGNHEADVKEYHSDMSSIRFQFASFHKKRVQSSACYSLLLKKLLHLHVHYFIMRALFL